jgi:hypothetical protein
MLKDQTRTFAETVRNMISSPKPESQAQSVATPDGGGDLIGNLEKLAKLRELGVLTEEEFVEQKQVILGRMT